MLLVAAMAQASLDSLVVKNRIFLRHERLIFWLVAVVLLGTTAVLHFWKLGSAPPGFYTDECSNAYNAWCIAQMGLTSTASSIRCFSVASMTTTILSRSILWFRS